MRRIGLIMLVAAVLALIALAVFWWLNRPEPEAAEQVIETAAPEAVRTEAEVPAVAFADVAAERGIDFVHDNGAYGDKLLPETMGGGGAFVDVDGDGDPDLVLVNGSDWPHRAGSSGGGFVSSHAQPRRT